MGILRAILPDGTEVEREISRHTLYRHGLAAFRDGRWVLISVHREEKTAEYKRKRLAGFYVPDKEFCARESLKVIPIVRDSSDMEIDHVQSSTMVSHSAVV